MRRKQGRVARTQISSVILLCAPKTAKESRKLTSQRESSLWTVMLSREAAKHLTNNLFRETLRFAQGDTHERAFLRRHVADALGKSPKQS